MSDQADVKLFADFALAFKKLQDPTIRPIGIAIYPADAWHLLCAIQLVSRDSRVVGDMRETVIRIGECIQQAYFNQGVLAEVAKHSWDSKYDI